MLAAPRYDHGIQIFAQLGGPGLHADLPESQSVPPHYTGGGTIVIANRTVKRSEDKGV